MGSLNFLKNYEPTIENHVHSASVIKWQIKFISVFQEICYYEIQINKESFIQYTYLHFM